MSASIIKPFGLLVILVCLSFSVGSKHAAWIIIHNSGKGGSPVDIRVDLLDKNEGIALHAELHLAPGIKELPEKKVKDGSYLLTVSANNALLQTSHPITFDSDRWIIINYVEEDSTAIIKSIGFIDATRYKKVNGKYASIQLYADNRRPANL